MLTDRQTREMIAKALASVIMDLDPERADEINAAIEARLLELFPTIDVWVPEQHKPGHWSLKNTITGEYYRTNGRHALRVVPFISEENATRKAIELNRELMR